MTVALKEAKLSEKNWNTPTKRFSSYQRGTEIPENGGNEFRQEPSDLPKPILNIATRIFFPKETSDCVISPL